MAADGAGDVKDRFTRLAPDDDSATQTEQNTFRFVFSNEKVGRDGHIVLNRGIQYANYLLNPVVLFAHDDGQPPIGRGSNIDTGGTNCRLDVTFVDRDILPFAGTLRDLVAGKWLRALSMSWQPIEWRYSTDRNRPGGIDFTKVDLLEMSVVPLPALPDALADARAHGVNVRPLREWASRSLDTGSYSRGAISRSLTEAIYRAARSRPSTRADRLRRAREIVRESNARAQRVERARQISGRGDLGDLEW